MFQQQGSVLEHWTTVHSFKGDLIQYFFTVFKLGRYFIEKVCIVALEEVNSRSCAESVETSPELKRPLVQCAVVHKIHKQTQENCHQYITSIRVTGGYICVFRDTC